MTGKKPKQLIKDRIQLLNLQIVRCANPGPCSSQPQGHKTAFKFHRIRCTKCLTSPDNHQKKESPHLKVVCLPVTRHMDMFHFQSLSCSDRKKNVSGCSAWLLSVKKAIHEDLKGQPERQDISKSWKNSMAGCCNLLR